VGGGGRGSRGERRKVSGSGRASGRHTCMHACTHAHMYTCTHLQRSVRAQRHFIAHAGDAFEPVHVARCLCLVSVCVQHVGTLSQHRPRVRYVSALEVDGTKRGADADREPKWMEKSVESARTLDALLDLERQAVRGLLCYSLWRLWLQAAVYVGDSSSGSTTPTDEQSS
jgi:hypothetical protein